jgi:hypothetical protein
MRAVLNAFFNDPRPDALDVSCIERQQAAPIFTHMTGYLSADGMVDHD